ncbi:MAG: lipocalin-like domain-containing protein [Chloroflexota bacterium]
MIDYPFAGTWRLVSYEVRSPNGKVRYPLGPDAVGYIMYGTDGRMAVAIMRRKRRPFARSEILAGTTEERAAATKTYLSYCGTYQVCPPDEVIHHVEVSLLPNWIGTAQQRFYQFDGNRLELSTVPLLLHDTQQYAVLIWERVSGEMNG